MAKNRRNAARREAFRVAILRPEGAPEAECLVWDVSASGAQVEIGSAVAVPDRFTLLVDAYALPRTCTVVRRDGRVLGVRFDA